MSVVIPLYNHERYFSECLMSLYNQGYRNIEIVLIDDQSTDESWDVAQTVLSKAAVRKRFKRVVCLQNQANVGAAATINRGISLAAGEVVMVVNSDDLYAPERVERCVREIEGGAGFVFSGVSYIGTASDAEVLEESAAFRTAVGEVTLFPTVSAALVQKNRAISTGNFCFRKEYWERAGGFRELRYCHDWDFILRVALLSEPHFIPEPLYIYRLHETNSFRSLSAVAVSDSRTCFEALFFPVVRGAIENPQLREVVEAPGFWDALVARAGPVAEEIWRRANAGESPAPTPPALFFGDAGEIGAEALDGLIEDGEAAGRGVENLLARKAGQSLALTFNDGKFYPDGWIGREVDLTAHLFVVQESLEVSLYCPRNAPSKAVVLTLTANGQVVDQQVTEVESDSSIRLPLLLKSEREARLKIAVADTHQVPGDERHLGIILRSVSSQ